MAGQKRGFGRERHNTMKLAVAVVSVCGFGATWYALGQGHQPLANEPGGAPAQGTAGAAVATAPAGPTGTAGPSGQAAPTAVALPTRRARTSRGS